MRKFYFDYASTTPVDEAVLAAMLPYYKGVFGNPSSSHGFGRAAADAVVASREVVAKAIQALPRQIIFTSGATEANNHVIHSVTFGRSLKETHIVVSAVEHHSVLEPIEAFARAGGQVTVVPVDAQGLVAPEAIKAVMTDQTVLVAVMMASNEIGTIQPIQAIGAITQEQGAALLVDAVQAIGHISVDVQKLPVDYLTMSAHKFYGPKGVGALYVRDGQGLQPLLRGGDQEFSRRASTQNVPGVVGMAKALELCQLNMVDEENLQVRLRDKLLREIPSCIEGVCINGALMQRLPNNAHFSFESVEGESLLMALDMAGIAASMGSACSSGAMDVSHVLKAIQVPDKFIHGSLRLTLGRWTTEESINYLLEQLPSIVAGLRL